MGDISYSFLQSSQEVLKSTLLCEAFCCL